MSLMGKHRANRVNTEIEAKPRRGRKRGAIDPLPGGIEHDVNNLFTILLGNLELLDERLDASSPEAKLTRAALDAARRGAALNKTLLAFARRHGCD